MPRPRLLGGNPVTFRPPMVTRPVSGRSNPAIRRSVVVLPQPDGPSSASISPAATSSFSGCRTRVPPKLLLIPSSPSGAGARLTNCLPAWRP